MTKHIKFFLLPFLIAIIPILFLYSHNVKVLTIPILISPLLIAFASVLLFYIIFFLYYRKMLSASFSAVFVVAANYMYGIIYYSILDQIKLIPAEHYILLPMFLYISFYAGYFFNLISPAIREAMHVTLLVMSVVLVGINIVLFIPAEVRKANLHIQRSTSTEEIGFSHTSEKYPDIYYIVLDEYADVDVIHEYWGESYMDSFIEYLENNNFYMVENSHSKTLETIYELASRLNLKEYPQGTDIFILYEEISSNRVMRLLKSYGYTTVVFYGPFQPYEADFNFGGGPGILKNETVETKEFKEILIDNSMLSAVSSLFEVRCSSQDIFDSTNYIFKKITKIHSIKSPKFVIAHILFPHAPFVVDKDGNVLGDEYQYDWNYYAGQHQYATEQLHELISNLLENIDQENPPIIIIQSDHGARNSKLITQNGINLDNYSQDYAYHIFFAMYLPGFNIAELRNNIDPIETFAIVLNHYFQTDIKVERLANKE